MSVTIWDPAANEGAGGIARVGTPVYTPAEDPDEPGTTEIVYGPPLARLTDPVWVRPRWHGTAAQTDPHGAGASNFAAGWVILVDETVPPSIPTGHKRGPDRETPLVDLEDLTAVWWTTVEMDSGDIADLLDKRKDSMKAEAAHRRWQVEEQGIVWTRPSDGKVFGIATDRESQGKLDAERAAALAGIRSEGDKWKCRDMATGKTVFEPFTDADVVLFANAARAHVAAAFSREGDVCDAIDDGADNAALDRVNVQAGSIQALVEGEWIAQGAWPAA